MDDLIDKISIIVPVHNAENKLKKLFRSFEKTLNIGEEEIIVIDDFSNEQTRKIITNFINKHKNVKLVKNEENLGYLKSCNKAIEYVTNDIFVLLNSDCEIPKNFTKKILKCFNSDNDIVVASPISSNSCNYYIPQILPLNFMNKHLEKRMPEYPEVFHCEGFCLCVRKSYTDKNGLFDPIYGMGYCEEVDFCFRVKESSKRCVLIDDLYVKHSHHASFKNKRNELLTTNNKILYKRWEKYLDYNPYPDKITEIIKQCFSKVSKFIFVYRKIKIQLQNNRLLTLKNLHNVKKYKFYKKEKVVYTAFSGKYDILPISPLFINNNWDYILFTDNKTLLKLKKFGVWQIRPFQFCELDNTRNARWHKTHPHILFPDYNESLWIDANIDILNPYIFNKIENTDKNLLIPIHYCRNCVYKELNVVKFLKKEDDEKLNLALQLLKENQMPENYGLNETNIIYRKHNDSNVIKIMEEWWNIIKDYSKRDQLSLSYVLWKNNINLEEISIDNATLDLINYKMYSHNPASSLTGKLLSLLLP